MEKTLLSAPTKKTSKISKQSAGRPDFGNGDDERISDLRLKQMIAEDLMQPRPKAIANLLEACRAL